MKLLVEPRFDLYVDIITARAKSEENVIQLQWGELAAKPPEEIVEFFLEGYRKGKIRYTAPQGDIELREAIRDKVRKKNRINVDVDNIIVTVGGTAAINFVFRIIAGDGGYIIIQDPSWFGYTGIANYVGARTMRILEIKYGYEEFKKAYEEVRAKGGELRGIVLNYPANPTGYVFDTEIMREAIDFAEDYDILIISDEAYEDYVFEGEHTSIGSIRGINNVLSVFTISKTYAFTGLRIGYAVGPEEIINAMATAQVHTYISPPAINQYVAMRILRENLDRPFVEENLKLLRKNLKIVRDFVYENSWEMVEPKGGIYAFIRLPGIKSQNFALKLLEEEKVAIAPGVDFGEKWTDWIRITIAKSEEEIVEGLSRIKKLYARWIKPPCTC